MGLTGQEKPSEEERLLRRVKRLERICLILCIDVILLSLSGIHLAGTIGRAIGSFNLITEQLNFIG